MKKYQAVFSEAFDPIANIDTRKKTVSILSELRDNVFQNKEARQKFNHLIHSLTISNDPMARKTLNLLASGISEIASQVLDEIKNEKRNI